MLRPMDYVVLLVLAASVFFLYRPVLHYGFIDYDDQILVASNAHVLRGIGFDSIVWSFTTFYGFWHPITWMSLMIDASVFGGSPRGFHATNLLLHIANTALVFAVIRRTGIGTLPAAIAAFIFAIHPANVQAVAWISERKGLLSSFFGLLCIFTFLSHRQAGGHTRSLAYSAFFILALLCKSNVLVIPALLALIDVLVFNPVMKNRTVPPANLFFSGCRYYLRSLADKWILCGLSLIFLVLTLHAEQQAGAVAQNTHLAVQNPLNAFLALKEYLRLFCCIGPFAIIYPYPTDPKLSDYTLSILLFGGMSALSLMLYRRLPLILLGWSFFCIALLPGSGLIKVGEHFIADRYLYLPEVGLLLALASVFDMALKGPLVSLMPCTGVICVFLLMALPKAMFQVSLWADSVRLFSYATTVTKSNFPANYILATLHRQRGDYQLADRHLDEALRLRPNDQQALEEQHLLTQLFSKPRETTNTLISPIK